MAKISKFRCGHVPKLESLNDMPQARGVTETKRLFSRLLRTPLSATLIGVGAFLAWQFAVSIWNLVHRSSSMDNKFSVLAREKFMAFLIGENLHMLVAYGILLVLGSILIWPWVCRLRTAHFSLRCGVAFLLALAIHGWFVLRLVTTRPYFLSEATFGSWYYQILEWPSNAVRPTLYLILFQLVPCVILGFCLAQYLTIARHRREKARRPSRRMAVASIAAPTAIWFLSPFLSNIPRLSPLSHETSAAPAKQQPMNILIIGSDSLRGDKLGCAGYRPARSDGAAAAGVSPAIDALAASSTRFERCYTPIASTLESSISFMGSQVPQTHGIRQMYPSKQDIARLEKSLNPLAHVLGEHGYHTAAIGDWCAGFYRVVPLGFQEISVSSFDNFKIYMSQAVVMAHFVVPLYFDHSIGYKIFPQITSFAQFVTPDVVTNRVNSFLQARAKKRDQPFFAHVFYSCNHLPYRASKGYSERFRDPSYRGKNESGVDFDIDSFIGGTDLESKWDALDAKEVAQIRALYDGCTREFDDCVKEILATLEAQNLAKNTIVIINSDHGDDLYEPDVTLGHGLTFNGASQANHTPMIVHVPNVAPNVIAEPIRSIDIAPTLCDLVGAPKPPEWEGQSVASWISREKSPQTQPLYAETGFPFIQFKVAGITRPKLPAMDELTEIDADFDYQFVLKPRYLNRLIEAKQRCLTTRHWKLVLTPQENGSPHFMLFRTEGNPDNQAAKNFAASRPEILAPMQNALTTWIATHRMPPIQEIFPNGEPTP